MGSDCSIVYWFFENYPLPKGEEGGEGISKISIRDVIEKVDYPLSIIAYEHRR